MNHSCWKIQEQGIQQAGKEGIQLANIWVILIKPFYIFSDYIYFRILMIVLFYITIYINIDDKVDVYLYEYTRESVQSLFSDLQFHVCNMVAILALPTKQSL